MKINQNQLGEDVEIVGSEHFDCEACRLAKAKKIISHAPRIRAEKAFQKLHTDLFPCTPTGIGGINHVVVIVDDATRCRFVLPIKAKSEASQELITWTEHVHNICGYWPQVWHCDNGAEFNHFIEWGERHSQSFAPAAHYAYEQNGIAEHSGHLLMQMARCLMIEANAPKWLWPEAVSTASFTLNRLRKPGDTLSPVQKWCADIGHPDPATESLAFLRVWYSKAYVTIPPELRVQSAKMAPRAFIGHLVGYEGQNGHVYRIYNPQTRRITRERDVVFWEDPAPTPNVEDDIGDSILVAEGESTPYRLRERPNFDPVPQQYHGPDVVITNSPPQPSLEASPPEARPTTSRNITDSAPTPPQIAPDSTLIPSRSPSVTLEDIKMLFHTMENDIKAIVTDTVRTQLKEQLLRSQSTSIRAPQRRTTSRLQDRIIRDPEPSPVTHILAPWRHTQDVPILSIETPEPQSSQYTAQPVRPASSSRPTPSPQPVPPPESTPRPAPLPDPTLHPVEAAERLIRQFQSFKRPVYPPPAHPPRSRSVSFASDTARAELISRISPISSAASSRAASPARVVSQEQAEPARPVSPVRQAESSPTTINTPQHSAPEASQSTPPTTIRPATRTVDRFAEPRKLDFDRADPQSQPAPDRDRVATFEASTIVSISSAPLSVSLAPDASDPLKRLKRASREPSELTRRSSRVVNAPKFFHEIDFAAKSKEFYEKSKKRDDDEFPPGVSMATVDDRVRSGQVTLPKTYKEAIASPIAHHWKEAMDKQIAKLTKAKTFMLILAPPKGATLLPGKWVYTVATDSDDFVTEYKARWVVCGNRQRPGLDFDDRYAPVASGQGTRLFLAASAARGWFILQFDVAAAYLNAVLDDRMVVMVQPTGYEQEIDGVPQACLILQALYGLKQAGCLWHKHLTRDLESLGFKASAKDPCIFTLDSSEAPIWLLVYVDDVLVTGPNKQSLIDLRDNLAKRVTVKTLPFTRFLGCDVHAASASTSGIILNQQAYIYELLDAKKMTNATPTATPFPTSYRPPPKSQQPKDDPDFVPLPETVKDAYKEDVGKLNWLAIKTRPDIAYGVNALQRRTSQPRKEDLDAVKHTLRYLKGTQQLGIPLGIQPKDGLIGFVDASYGGAEDSYSTEGWIFFFAGSPISWSSKKQAINATSSTVAEYCAMLPAVQEAIFLADLAADLGIRPRLHDIDETPQDKQLIEHNDPVPIFTDSDNAVAKLTDFRYNPTTRWIATRYHFVRDAVQKRQVEMHLIATTSNAADVLTKALNPEKFTTARSMLAMQVPEQTSQD